MGVCGGWSVQQLRAVEWRCATPHARWDGRPTAATELTFWPASAPLPLPLQDSSNALGLSSSSETAVTLIKYGSSVSWVRMAFGSKDKCMSAQWGDGGDAAAVMYACQVGAGGSTTSGSTLEPTKQWWVLVPTDGTTDSSWGASQLKLLKVAQEESVETRANARYKRSLGPTGHDRMAKRWHLKRRTVNKVSSRSMPLRVVPARRPVCAGRCR